MIKTRFWIALGILLAFAPAYALNEATDDNYGVPPVLSLLTPEEIQADTALNRYAGSSKYGVYGGIVLEPVLIKCINGAPAFYYVYTYKGTDNGKKEAMEEVIRLFNDDEGFYLEEIAPSLNTLRNNYSEYCTFMYQAWDFGGCYAKTPAIDGLLYEFETYIEIAKKHLGISGEVKIKLYADSPVRSKFIFGIKKPGHRERYLWPIGFTGWVLDEKGRVKEYTGYEEATEEEIIDCYHRGLEYLKNKYKANPESFDEDITAWAKTREKMETLKKEGDYYRVVEPDPE